MFFYLFLLNGATYIGYGYKKKIKKSRPANEKKIHEAMQTKRTDDTDKWRHDTHSESRTDTDFYPNPTA